MRCHPNFLCSLIGPWEASSLLDRGDQLADSIAWLFHAELFSPPCFFLFAHNLPITLSTLGAMTLLGSFTWVREFLFLFWVSKAPGIILLPTSSVQSLSWLCGSQQTLENSLRDGNTTPPDLPPEKSVCRSKKQQIELDMEQWTGSKLGKEYIKAVYCHPAYLTYMQSTSCEMLGWMKHKLESRLTGEISITQFL